MAIDTEQLYKVLIDKVGLAIGSELSTVGSGANQRPSVTKARSGVSRLKYPFVTLDLLNIEDAASYLTNRIAQEDGSVDYEVYKNIPFVFQVRAKNTESYGLAAKLHKYFTYQFVLEDLLSKGITVKSKTDIESVPDLQSTKYQEFSTFTLTISVKDVDNVTEDGYISSVEVSTNVDGITEDNSSGTPETP